MVVCLFGMPALLCVVKCTKMSGNRATHRLKSTQNHVIHMANTEHQLSNLEQQILDQIKQNEELFNKLVFNTKTSMFTHH